MYEYVHGGDIYALQKQKTDMLLDFSANINPMGLPEEVKTAIVGAIQDCVNYPDPFCRQLTAALGEHENVQQEKILCSNGASELIFRIALAVKPKKALLLAPTFADYERALRTIGCTMEYYRLSAENDFSIGDDYLTRIDRELDILFICNPNNPTGQLTAKPFLGKVLEKCRKTKTLVVIDECFMDFVPKPGDHSAQEYLDTFTNLIILKAFTKIYAMPGIRLGYVLASDAVLLDKLRFSGQDWSVSTFAQAAGLSALRQKGYVEQTRALIEREREFLIEEIRKIGMQVFGSKANYIFFNGNGIGDLQEKLLTQGILIRSCSNYVNLDKGYYRVAVKKRNENLRLIRSIKEVLTNESSSGCD